MDKIEQINKELAGRVMPDIEYIALLNTKVIILQALADTRLELLKAAKSWLESYLEYLDNDSLLGDEPNNSLAKLIDELAEAIDV